MATPIVEAMLGTVGANVLGRFLGGVFGRRRSRGLSQEEKALLQTQKEMLDLQKDILLKQQNYFETVEQANREAFLRLLPSLRNTATSALAGLGFTREGQDLGIRNLWLFRQGLKTIEDLRRQAAMRYSRMGLTPDQIEALTQRTAQEGYLDLLAQAEAQNAQRLLQGLGVMQSLMGSEMYSPNVASQLLGSASSLFGQSLSAAQNQLQTMIQRRLDEWKAQQQMSASVAQNFASILGYLYGKQQS
ncbi:MAG: hypothetical protein QXW98_06165 [Candidatus Caldarchaeum sp.]